MPNPVPYTPIPYVRPAYQPDTRTIADLMQAAANARVQNTLQQGQMRGQGIMNLGLFLSNALGAIRQERDQKAEKEAKRQFDYQKLAQEQQDKQQEFALRAAQFQETERQRQEQNARLAAQDQRLAAGDVVENTLPGPIDPTAAATLRSYLGTAPLVTRQTTLNAVPMSGEMAPPSQFDVRGQTRKEADLAAASAATAKQREIENARLAAKPEPNPTEASLALLAANGNEGARRALAIIASQRAGAEKPKAYEWVTLSDGNVAQVEKGTAPPGSKPYSANAAQGLASVQVQARNRRAAAALNSVEKLKELAPVRSEGPAGIVEGMGDVAKGYLGYDTNARQFQALIQPTAMQMAVAVQGAANLSDTERKTMAEMLGSINKMDYKSQMALLDNALQLIRNGADVQQISKRDPLTGKIVKTWVEAPRTMPGEPMSVTVPPASKDGTYKVGKFTVKVEP